MLHSLGNAWQLLLCKSSVLVFFTMSIRQVYNLVLWIKYVLTVSTALPPLTHTSTHTERKGTCLYADKMVKMLNLTQSYVKEMILRAKYGTQ